MEAYLTIHKTYRSQLFYTYYPEKALEITRDAEEPKKAFIKESAPILARGTRFALCRDGLLVAMISLCESASTKAAVATCQILEWHVHANLDATDRQHAHFILARAFALSRNHRTLIEHIHPRNSSIPARAYLQQVLEGGIEDRCILWRARAGASFAVPSDDDGKSDALIEVSWRLDR